MPSTSDICIRAAELDYDQLLCLRLSLWPKSFAEEHDRELTRSRRQRFRNDAAHHFRRGGKRWNSYFLKIALRSHADGCNREVVIILSGVARARDYPCRDDRNLKPSSR